MRVALVHEFLTQLGGAERVLDELHGLYPDAPVFTLFHDSKKTSGHFVGWDIRTSFLQRTPGAVKHYKWFLALMPKAIQSFDLAGYDLVISDASAFAKGVRVKKPALHICYCHTPTRYLWQDEKSYIASLPYGPLVKSALPPILRVMRQWDYAAAQRVDYFIANSQEVQTRIKRFYNRDADVIYPPIDTKFFMPAAGKSKDTFFLTAGRHEPYKRLDIIIEAANRLKLPLKIAGTGSITKKLQAAAGPTVEFLGRVSDEALRSYMQAAQAFVFAAREDAGMVMLEAMAAGTPVVAYRAGGALEFVEPGLTGELFDEQTADALAAVLTRFDPSCYAADALLAKAQQFDKTIFCEKFRAFIVNHMQTQNLK